MNKHPRNTKTAAITRIEGGVLYFEECAQCTLEQREKFEASIVYEKSIRLLSLDSIWYQRELLGEQLVKADIDFEMTLRAEMRSGTKHWYAYRRVLGTLYKRYVGTVDRVTSTRLVEIARHMPTTKIGIRR